MDNLASAQTGSSNVPQAAFRSGFTQAGGDAREPSPAEPMETNGNYNVVNDIGLHISHKISKQGDNENSTGCRPPDETRRLEDGLADKLKVKQNSSSLLRPFIVDQKAPAEALETSLNVPELEHNDNSVMKDNGNLKRAGLGERLTVTYTNDSNIEQIIADLNIVLKKKGRLKDPTIDEMASYTPPGPDFSQLDEGKTGTHNATRLDNAQTHHQNEFSVSTQVTIASSPLSMLSPPLSIGSRMELSPSGGVSPSEKGSSCDLLHEDNISSLSTNESLLNDLSLTFCCSEPPYPCTPSPSPDHSHSGDFCSAAQAASDVSNPYDWSNYTLEKSSQFMDNFAQASAETKISVKSLDKHESISSIIERLKREFSSHDPFSNKRKICQEASKNAGVKKVLTFHALNPDFRSLLPNKPEENIASKCQSLPSEFIEDLLKNIKSCKTVTGESMQNNEAQSDNFQGKAVSQKSEVENVVFVSPSNRFSSSIQGKTPSPAAGGGKADQLILICSPQCGETNSQQRNGSIASPSGDLFHVQVMATATTSKASAQLSKESSYFAAGAQLTSSPMAIITTTTTTADNPVKMTIKQCMTSIANTSSFSNILCSSVDASCHFPTPSLVPITSHPLLLWTDEGGASPAGLATVKVESENGNRTILLLPDSVMQNQSQAKGTAPSVTSFVPAAGDTMVAMMPSKHPQNLEQTQAQAKNSSTTAGLLAPVTMPSVGKGRRSNKDPTASQSMAGSQGNQESETSSMSPVVSRASLSQLPADIPTMSTLALTAPKLSTWRQTRIISEKLEEHLWTWRCACKKSGKRISKSLLQARAKWAFRKAGITEFKASDGWYWKWLAKWRRKGDEIGISEVGDITDKEREVLPGQSSQSVIKKEMFDEEYEYGYEDTSEDSNNNNNKSSENLEDGMCECDIKEEDHGDCLEDNGPIEEAQDEPELIQEQQFADSSDKAGQTRKRFLNEIAGKYEDASGNCGPKNSQTKSEEDILNSIGSGSLDSFISNRVVPLRDILPLTLNGNELCLAPSPTDSSLPISPIFIRSPTNQLSAAASSKPVIIGQAATGHSQSASLDFVGHGQAGADNLLVTEGPHGGESVRLAHSSLVGSDNALPTCATSEDGRLTLFRGMEPDRDHQRPTQKNENFMVANDVEGLEDFLNIDSLYCWHQENIEDIDTDQLVSSLCPDSLSSSSSSVSSLTSASPSSSGEHFYISGDVKQEVMSPVSISDTSALACPDGSLQVSSLPVIGQPVTSNQHDNNNVWPIAQGSQVALSVVSSSSRSVKGEGTAAAATQWTHDDDQLNLASNGADESVLSPVVETNQNDCSRFVIGSNLQAVRPNSVCSSVSTSLFSPAASLTSHSPASSLPAASPSSTVSSRSTGSPACKRSSSGGVDGPRKKAKHPCGIHCKRLKRVGDVLSRSLSSTSEEPAGQLDSTNTSQLTSIAIHKRRGEDSLNRFKEEVRKYAVDHTFKETAKRFGIHHSTVSGWVKESEKQEKSNSYGDNLKEKGDDMFINWLRQKRETGQQVTLVDVKRKVGEILLDCGLDEVEKSCKWFLLWHNRREEKLYVEGMEDEDVKKETQNLAYPPAFKLEVALFAKKHSQYAAAKIFNVARRRIFDWMRQIPKLEELIAKGHMKKMTGRGPKNRDIDQALYTWYCERKARGNRPKSCHVQAKARELYLTYGYSDMKCSYGWFKRWSQRFQIQLRYSYDDEILEWIMARFDTNQSVTAQDLQTYGLSLVQREDPSFKASSGWALRFCKRHKEYMKSESSLNCKLPPHLDIRVHTFRRVLTHLHKEKMFPFNRIGAMDELCLHFSCLTERRSGNCCLKHPGIDSADATVILSCLADGTLLPPLVILRAEGASGKSMVDLNEVVGDLSHSRSQGDPQTKNASADGPASKFKTQSPPVKPVKDPNSPQENNEGYSLIMRGSTIGLQRRPGAHNDGEGSGAVVGVDELTAWLELIWFQQVPAPSFLLADSYPVHTAPKIQSAVLKSDSVLAIIPTACSSKLQPLHQGLKTKFRDKIEESYLNSIGGSQVGLLARGLGGSGSAQSLPVPSSEKVLTWVETAYQTLKNEKSEIADCFKNTETCPLQENSRGQDK